MKKFFIILVLMLFLGEITVTQAQSVQEIFQLSETNYGYSTARSSAMGGAFVSLGADPASININPAGLGMYRSSEVSFSPALKIATMSTKTVTPFSSTLSDRKNRVSGIPNNAAFIYNIINGDRKGIISGLTIGLSYNQAANETYKMISHAPAANNSIADYFAAQLYNVNPENITSSNSDPYSPYQNYSVSQWGGILAYNTGLIFPDQNEFGDFAYYTDQYNDAGELVGSLLMGDKTIPSLYRKMTRKTGEYNFSIGGSISDILFFGMTMGVLQIEANEYNFYRETTPETNRGDLAELRYDQWLTKNGTAFNFKAGITAQPIKGLKIGFAVHAPNIYHIDEEYSAAMNNYYFVSNGLDQYRAETAFLQNSYRVHTPPRIMGGISYTLGVRGVISFDYERIWYNKMKVTEIGYEPQQIIFQSEIASVYKPTDNFRAGIEFNPFSGLFLRAGYAYYGSALKNDSKNANSVTNISSGIGYRNQNFYVDLAYIHVKKNMSPFRYYSSNYGDESIESPSVVYPKLKENNLILSVGVKF